MSEETKWIKRLGREREARRQAEKLLEEKSLELFKKNMALEETLQNLEKIVDARTAEIKRLSLVASRATCGVVITDAVGNTEWINDGFRRITGYEFEDIVGKIPGHVLQGPGTDPETIELMRQKIQAREPFSTEVLNYTKKGKPYWIRLDANPIFDDSGRLQNFISIQTNVTERKLAEERMRLLTAALEQSSEGFALTDSNGVFTYLNEAHVRIFGYTYAGEIIGKSWEVLYEKEEAYRIKNHVFPRLVKTGTWKGIVQARKKDLTTFPEDLSLTLLDDGRIICACRDDTERAASEEALRSAIEKTGILNNELSKTVSELDAYAHTVAHDLRNPVMGITGLAETLRDNWNEISEDEKKSFLDMLFDSSKSLEDIIRELLILSSIRYESIQKTVINQRTCLENVKVRLGYLIHKKNAKIEIEKNLLKAVGYAPWLEEVFANLISNAIKYGGDPPVIRIGTEVSGDAWVRTCVDDNGRGIPESRRESMFTAFTRNHSEVEGHGLGLSIVMRIISKLGGKVGIQDSPLGGARFYFELPADPG